MTVTIGNEIPILTVKDVSSRFKDFDKIFTRGKQDRKDSVFNCNGDQHAEHKKSILRIDFVAAQARKNTQTG